MSEEHEVVTKFKVDPSDAEKSGGRIEKIFHRVEGSIDRAKERFNEIRKETNLTIPALLGVGLGVGAIIEKVKEANAEFGSTRKQIAGLYAGSLVWDKSKNLVDRYKDSIALATETTEQLDNVAARFGANLGDVGHSYTVMAGALRPLGLSTKSVLDVTEKVVGAAKATGISAEEAGDKITKFLLYRSVRGTDLFSQALRGVHGNLRKMTQPQLFQAMTKSLDQLAKQGDLMSQGLGDNINRIHMKVEELFRGVTGPVFAEVAKDLGEFAKKVTELDETGKPLIEAWAGRLVDAFHVLENVTTTLLKHWKEIAGIWAGMKAAKLGSQLASGAGEALGSKALGAAGKGGAWAGVAGAAIGLGAAGLAELYGNYSSAEGEQQASMKKFRQLNNLRQQYDELAARQKEISEGEKFLGPKPYGPGGQLHDMKADVDRSSDEFKKKFRETMKDLGFDSADAIKKGLHEAFNRGAAEGILPSGTNKNALFAGLLGAAPDLLKDSKQEGAEKERKFDKTVAPTNININKLVIEQKFDDVDPDRVFIRFQEDLQGLARNPTQSFLAEPHGH